MMAWTAARALPISTPNSMVAPVCSNPLCQPQQISKSASVLCCGAAQHRQMIRRTHVMDSTLIPLNISGLKSARSSTTVLNFLFQRQRCAKMCHLRVLEGRAIGICTDDTDACTNWALGPAWPSVGLLLSHTSSWWSSAHAILSTASRSQDLHPPSSGHFTPCPNPRAASPGVDACDACPKLGPEPSGS